MQTWAVAYFLGREKAQNYVPHSSAQEPHICCWANPFQSRNYTLGSSFLHTGLECGQRGLGDLAGRIVKCRKCIGRQLSLFSVFPGCNLLVFPSGLPSYCARGCGSVRFVLRVGGWESSQETPFSPEDLLWLLALACSASLPVANRTGDM